MPKCTILVGVPGSGKSTWLNDNFGIMPNTFIASTDDIISRCAQDLFMTYDEAFKPLIKFAENAMWKRIEIIAKHGHNICVDRTNLTAKSRARFINMLKPYGYTFEAMVFETPDDNVWERRLKNRPGKTIPPHVLESMADNIEIPLMSEGFATINFVG